MLKYILTFVFFLAFLFIGCNKANDVNDLADLFCGCAAPIVEWNKGLDYHYEKLSESNAVKKKVSECLAADKARYASKKEDKEFQRSVGIRINEQCPEANSSVQAMFILLFQ